MNLDFILPANIKPNFAKLSVKFRLFRTYSSFSLASTGTDASAESGHSHSHGHTLHVGTTVGAANASFIGAAAGLGSSSGGTPFDTDSTVMNTDAQGSSGHSHSHTHTVSGTSALGVAESGSITTISAIAIDGTDVTAQCPATATTPAGGPWSADFVDLDLTSLVPTGDGGWHYLSLTAAGLGRLIAILRLG